MNCPPEGDRLDARFVLGHPFVVAQRNPHDVDGDHPRPLARLQRPISPMSACESRSPVRPSRLR